MAEKKRLNPKEKIENIKRLMSIWWKREDEWLSCDYVKSEGLKIGLPERTLERYLVTKENPFFEIDNTKGERKRFCKPKPDVWTMIMLTVPFKFGNPQEELLFEGRKGKKGTKPIIGIKNIVREKYNEALTWYDEQYQKVGDLRLIDRPKGVSPVKQNTIRFKTDNLLEAIKTSLSFEYFDKGIPLEDIYYRLGSNVAKVVSAYMELWVFLVKNYGGAEKFEEQMGKLQEELQKMTPKIKSMKYKTEH